jgi:hypothetical protein
MDTKIRVLLDVTCFVLIDKEKETLSLFGLDWTFGKGNLLSINGRVIII